jgi:tRNA (pseudouridine54-N1)-methyltransferase
MNLVFFIKSETIKLDNYTIKNIPGSTGRLDVISRCILAALLNNDSFDLNVKIWVFLDKYGTLIFDPLLLNYDSFPKNELKFTDYFISFLVNKDPSEIINNPFKSVQKSQMSIIKAIHQFQKNNYSQFILKEEGEDFFKIRYELKERRNVLFIIGSQEDDFLDSDGLLALKIPTISIGRSSYLASSVIKLLKLHILID